jgi:uncharacterized RDD family membrane protein YckC
VAGSHRDTTAAEPASLLRRLVAASLDTAFGVAIVALTLEDGPGLRAAATPRGLAELCAGGYAYTVIFESSVQATPGKVIASVRVESLGGGRPTLRASAVRNLLRLADLLPGFYLVGGVAALTSSRRQRLGDRAASCVVVRHSFSPRARRMSAVLVATSVALAVTGSARTERQ